MFKKILTALTLIMFSHAALAANPGPIYQGSVAYKNPSTGGVAASLSTILSADCVNANSMFGANGTAGDGAKINNAISAARADNGGPGCVFFPQIGKAYYIDTGLSVPNGVALIGTDTMDMQGITVTLAQWTAYGTWFECGLDASNPCVTLGGHGDTFRGINIIFPQAVPPTSVTFTATVNAGGTTLTSASSIAGLSTGMHVYCFGTLGGATIASTPSGSTVTLSATNYAGGTGQTCQAWTAYSPNTYQDAIYVTSSLFRITNSLMIGGTNCINVNYNSTSGGGTYAQIDNVKLGCLGREIILKDVNDTVNIHQVDARPFWYATYPSMVYYLESGSIGLDINYADNPFVTDFQCLFLYQCMRFTDSTVQGNTHSLYNGQISRLQCNLVRVCMSVAATTTTVSFAANNVQAQQDTSVGGWSDTLFYLGTDHVDALISDARVIQTGGQILAVGNGTGGHVGIGAMTVGTNISGTTNAGWGTVSALGGIGVNAGGTVGIGLLRKLGSGTWTAGSGTVTSGTTY